MSEVNICVENGTDLDPVWVARFQRAAFSASSTRLGAARIQVPAYYAWKYHAPWGPARVASAFEGARRVAMVAAVPMPLTNGALVRPAWQICDIATDPASRGRGLFRACLNALLEEIGDAVVFCFPNGRSRKGLAGTGFAEAARLRLHAAAGPLLGRFGPGRLPAPRPGSWRVHRDRAFLDWRFMRRPGHSYEVAAQPGALMVVRRLRVLGLPASVVMASEAADREQGAALLARLAQGAFAVLRIDGRDRGAFIAVPNVLLPRSFPVLVKGLARGALDLEAGDWDVL